VAEVVAEVEMALEEVVVQVMIVWPSALPERLSVHLMRKVVYHGTLGFNLYAIRYARDKKREVVLGDILSRLGSSHSSHARTCYILLCVPESDGYDLKI
jgi:hypothetical protein